MRSLTFAAHTTAMLVESSKDKALSKSIERCGDLLVSLKADAVEPWRPGFAEHGQEAVEHFIRCTTGSRHFKEQYAKTFEEFGDTIAFGVSNLVQAVRANVVEVLAEALQVDDPANVELSQILTDVKALTKSINTDVAATLHLCRLEVLQPACEAFGTKSMNAKMLDKLQRVGVEADDVYASQVAWANMLKMLHDVPGDASPEKLDHKLIVDSVQIFLKHGYMSVIAQQVITVGIQGKIEDQMTTDLTAAIAAFDATLLEFAAPAKSPKSGASSSGAALFSGSMEDMDFVKPITKHKPGADEYALVEKLCNVIGRSKQHVLAIATVRYHTDGLRVEMAAVAMHVTSVPPLLKVVKVGDNEVEELFVKDADLVDIFKHASNKIDEFEAFLSMTADNAELKDELDLARERKKEARSMLRNFAERIKSTLLDTLDRLKTNVRKGVPEDWKSYCVEDVDGDRVIEEIVKNPFSIKLAASMNAMKKGAKSLGHIVSKLAEACHSPGMCMPETFKKECNDLADDGKAMVAIRAVCAVTYIKLPKADNAKSKTALVREVKRLVAALDVSIDTRLWDKLQDAASS